mgnify:CR=1 FL=1
MQLEVLLAEHKALRDEILAKTHLHVEIYIAFVATLGIFYGVIASNHLYDLIYLLPILALSLLLRIIWDQKIITVISHYLFQMEETIVKMFGSMCASNPELHQNPLNFWTGWQHYYWQHAPKHYYEWSMVLLFIVISILPSILYSLLCIFPTILLTSIDTKISSILHWTIFSFNLVVMLCTYCLIRENVFKRRGTWVEHIKAV